MKCVHIIDSAGLYGAEVMLLNLATEQIKLGYQVEIISIGGKNNPEKQLESEALKRGIQVYPYRMRNGPNYWGACRILRDIKSRQADIIHSHGYKGNILFGLMPRFIRGMPMVSTLHGWTNTDPFSKMLIYEELDALSLRQIEAIVVVNAAMLNHRRIRKLQRNRIHVIENGISEPTINTASEPDQKIIDFCKQRPTVISIGRFTKEKGHVYLINAFAQIVDEGIDAQLLLIGEGPERTIIESQIVKLGLSSRSYLPGYRNDAWQYLPYCGVFVLSSLTEGLPITLLEAIYQKIPIVATDVGGIPRLIKHKKSGMLVAPGEPNQLSEAILSIFHNRQLAMDMTEVSLSIVRETYTCAKMALAYDKVYRAL